MTSTWRAHWREYAIEAALLGSFMMSAATFATLLQHPDSPLFTGFGTSIVERLPMGVAMGATAMALIYSPWGVRSGAHMNPAVTLAFWRLQKIAGRDAFMYVLAQLCGGMIGIVLATMLLAGLPAHVSVNYVATIPGKGGLFLALVGESAISCGLMLVVLAFSSNPRLSKFTGIAAAVLVCACIIVEAPLSGMSMNPARSLGPAVLARTLDSMWIYILGPIGGMVTGAHLHRRLAHRTAPCAKLHHPSTVPCIHCGAAADLPLTLPGGEEVSI